MRQEGSVTIDLSKASYIDIAPLCRAINNAAEAFFRDPANVAEFEAWLKEYKKRGEN